MRGERPGAWWSFNLHYASVLCRRRPWTVSAKCHVFLLEFKYSARSCPTNCFEHIRRSQ